MIKWDAAQNYLPVQKHNLNLHWCFPFYSTSISVTLTIQKSKVFWNSVAHTGAREVKTYSIQWVIYMCFPERKSTRPYMWNGWWLTIVIADPLESFLGVRPVQNDPLALSHWILMRTFCGRWTVWVPFYRSENWVKLSSKLRPSVWGSQSLDYIWNTFLKEHQSL